MMARKVTVPATFSCMSWIGYAGSTLCSAIGALSWPGCPSLSFNSAKRITQLPPAELRLGMFNVIEYKARWPNTCNSSGVGFSTRSTLRPFVFGAGAADAIIRSGSAVSELLPKVLPTAFEEPALGSPATGDVDVFGGAPTCNPGGAPFSVPEPAPFPLPLPPKPRSDVELL